jgi:hypothetical protein
MIKFPGKVLNITNKENNGGGVFCENYPQKPDSSSEEAFETVHRTKDTPESSNFIEMSSATIFNPIFFSREKLTDMNLPDLEGFIQLTKIFNNKSNKNENTAKETLKKEGILDENYELHENYQ